MILKAAEKIDVISLTEEANKYADGITGDDNFPWAAQAGFVDGFKRCAQYIEDRKLEGVGFQQLMYELKIITES